MLEQLAALIKEQAGESVINNPLIPNEQNESVMAMAGSSVVGGLQQLMSSGGLKDVMNLFNSGNVQNNAATQNISGNFIQQLTGQLGLNQQQAGGIASSLIPGILSSLVGQTNDPNNNNFNIQGIFNQLSGGKTSGLDVSSLMTKFAGAGMDKDGDGDTDLQDLMAAFSGNGASANNAGNGMMDMLKKFLG